MDGRERRQPGAEGNREPTARIDRALAGPGAAPGVKSAARRIVCEVLDAHEPTSLTDVRFIAYPEDASETVAEVAASVREGRS